MPPRDVLNLARYGATTRHVVHQQLPTAVASKAPLMVVVVGVNDLLDIRKPYDVAEFRRDLRTVFDALTGANTTVVTAKYPDIPANLEISEFVRRPLRHRFAEANEAVSEIATSSGVVCIDLTRRPVWHDWTLWDPDRVHPGPHLHQRFAEELMSVTESFRTVRGSVSSRTTLDSRR
jgi:lysophospholipase L1-like esterase